MVGGTLRFSPHTHLPIYAYASPPATSPRIRMSPARVSPPSHQVGCQHTKAGDALRQGLSGGQRRRLSIALGLISRPKVPLLPEYLLCSRLLSSALVCSPLLSAALLCSPLLSSALLSSSPLISPPKALLFDEPPLGPRTFYGLPRASRPPVTDLPRPSTRCCSSTSPPRASTRPPPPPSRASSRRSQSPRAPRSSAPSSSPPPPSSAVSIRSAAARP